MKLKLIPLALATSGLVATAGAQAFNWNPSDWIAGKVKVSQNVGTPSQATQASAQIAPSSSVAPAPIGQIAAPNYRAIFERYAPAVVGITTEGTSKTGLNRIPGLPRGMPDDPFFRFFKGLPGFNGEDPRLGEAPVHGQGSGFIVGRDGLILTNAHVVRDADEVTVKLSDRREYKAKVLGSDTVTDVAVLKINAENLPAVALGNPAQLSVGDYVFAIGSPFGFEQSASAGIVSAKGRALPGGTQVPFIQTDVAVNPGNSGGPLFDANGSVVGINAQIYSRTGGYQGLSFAIPIDVALRVKDQIVATGKVVHPRLGVTIQELNQSLAESFKLSTPDGALVSSVVPGSAAAKAGIEPGDVILKFNSQPIGRSSELPAMVAAGRPGEKAAIEVWRNGRKLVLSATVGEAKDEVATADNSSSEPSGSKGRLGIAARALTPAEKNEANLPAGVVVEQASGPAARAGIEPGDVIVAVNGTQVKSVEQLQSLVSKESRNLAVLVQRGGTKIFIPVKLG
ncbi:DegQ family serine endoprotease [soil metagenome]